MLATQGFGFQKKSWPSAVRAMWPSTPVEKVTQMGGRVITACDSGATIVDEAGIDAENAVLSWT
jgi:glutamate dehydrogenase (NADP+)